MRDLTSGWETLQMPQRQDAQAVVLAMMKLTRTGQMVHALPHVAVAAEEEPKLLWARVTFKAAVPHSAAARVALKGPTGAHVLVLEPILRLRNHSSLRLVLHPRRVPTTINHALFPQQQIQSTCDNTGTCMDVCGPCQVGTEWELGGGASHWQRRGAGVGGGARLSPT